MNIVVKTVGEHDDNVSGETSDNGLQVVELVDRTSTHRVLVDDAHSPAQRAPLSPQLSVVLPLGFLEKSVVVSIGILVATVLAHVDASKSLFAVVGVRAVVGIGIDGISVGGLDELLRRDDLRLNMLGGGNEVTTVLFAVLDGGVVGNLGLRGIGRCLALEEQRTLDDIGDLEGVILLDNPGVDIGQEEQSGQDEESEAYTEGDRGDVPGRLLVQLETGRSLVNDGKGADSSGDEEEEGRSPDSPLDGVTTLVNSVLDQREDNGTEAARDEGSHAETGEDSTETLIV